MREIRQSGSEGGVADNGHPYPYRTRTLFSGELCKAQPERRRVLGARVKVSHNERSLRPQLSRTVFSFADNTGLSLDVSALPDWDSFTFVPIENCFFSQYLSRLRRLGGPVVDLNLLKGWYSTGAKCRSPS